MEYPELQGTHRDHHPNRAHDHPKVLGWRHLLVACMQVVKQGDKYIEQVTSLKAIA